MLLAYVSACETVGQVGENEWSHHIRLRAKWLLCYLLDGEVKLIKDVIHYDIVVRAPFCASFEYKKRLVWYYAPGG